VSKIYLPKVINCAVQNIWLMQELYLTTTSERFEATDPVKEKATEVHDHWTSELMPCLMELASKIGHKNIFLRLSLALSYTIFSGKAS